VVAGLLTKWLGATLLLDVHDPMSELYQANYHVKESHLLVRAIKLQEYLCYKLPDHLVTVSQSMAENIAKKSGRPVETIKVIYNFSDLGKFPILEGKQEWPRNKNSFVILYAGTVTEHYGLDIALRAVAAAAKDIPNIHFRILGDGNRLHDILLLASELGIRDRVEHLKLIPPEQVKEVMATADIGISAHHDGGFGYLYFSNKIIDYMTQMVPVLSSRTYTIEKLISEDAVFYFEPGNVEDLAKQIINMYNNPDLVEKKINNAKKLIGKYNWQAEKKNLISFYNELLKIE
jgi:glycosyltransferase involved in cell wall biosynthesis